MNVSALEKGTGKTSKITITNEKGRLSKEDIEKMVGEAERYKDEDEKMKNRIEAKNGLENYCFTIRNTLNDENLKDKFTEDDRKLIEEISKEGLNWLENNSMAESSEMEAKQKEIESKFNPIMTRIYQATGGRAGGMPDEMRGAPGAATAGGADTNDLD